MTAQGVRQSKSSETKHRNVNMGRGHCLEARWEGSRETIQLAQPQHQGRGQKSTKNFFENPKRHPK